MIRTLAIEHYRSLRDVQLSLSQLNLITGSNGCGKSNLYRALSLLAASARESAFSALAAEGGLHSVYWAGPEHLTHRMRQGWTLVQGQQRDKPMRLRLGFGTDDWGYSVAFGAATPPTDFPRDPEIKHEAIWQGPQYRQAKLMVERQGHLVKVRERRQWQVVSQHAPLYSSVFDQITHPNAAPEVFVLREWIRSWRFYDQFRSDADAPARRPHLTTRTPVLHHDGRDLASALLTIREIGDSQALDEAIDDAFPGSRWTVSGSDEAGVMVALRQPGMLRPLNAMELSDGTLRYLLWVAALLTPRPPPLMVLNEPENSLHPDLLPALARLIIKASVNSQVWVISHANSLVKALADAPDCQLIRLRKSAGETLIEGQDLLDRPAWHWPKTSGR